MEETRAALPRPSDPLPPDRLLELYVAGECTLIEQAAMEHWMAAHPDIGAALRAMRTDGEMHASLPREDSETWHGAIQMAAGRPEHFPSGSPSLRGGEPESRSEPGRGLWYGPRTMPSGVSAWPRRWWTVAGLGAIVLSAALFRHGPRGYPVESAARSYTTQPGERAIVTLSDGSVVTLAPQTSLVVARGFGAANRTVRVVGEAYFDVANAAGTPFAVHAGAATMRVLGTTFDVTHYPGDRVARVAVVSGKVVVTPTSGARRVQGGMLVVTGGMVARVSDSVVTLRVAEDLTAYSAWTRGALTFREAPVLEVLAAIGHWYGYQFRVADSTVASRHLTAVFEGESRGDVLRSLETLLNVTMEFDGAVVTVRSRQERPGSQRPGRRTGVDSLGTINREVGR